MFMIHINGLSLIWTTFKVWKIFPLNGKISSPEYGYKFLHLEAIILHVSFSPKVCNFFLPQTVEKKFSLFSFFICFAKDLMLCSYRV